MASLSIRPATPSDGVGIVDFNFRLAVESENKTLDRSTLESGVAALLEDPGKGSYFLAATGSGEIVGQLMITYEWSDWRNGLFWWLQSVYVIPEFRKQGVFTELLNHVSALALGDPEVCGIRLYVDKDNAPAQSTYGARGFEHGNYELMEQVFAPSGGTDC